MIPTKTMWGEGHGAAIDNGQTQYEIENELVAMLDDLPLLRRYEKMFSDLCKGSIDIPAAIKQITVPAFMELVRAMHTADAKTRANIAQDFLDRAGHGKTTNIKVSAGNVDVDDSKTELVNFILSSAKRNQINVIEGEKVEKAKDVTPAKSTKSKSKSK